MGRGPSSALAFLGAMFVSSSASAVSDVVVDSMVVERARGESQVRGACASCGLGMAGRRGR